MKQEVDEGAGTWLLLGVALGALFLLRTSSIFGGAVLGFAMFVGIIVMMGYWPSLRNILFGWGGATDILVSFGLPFLITKVMSVTGQTSTIATITTGLLFSWHIKTKQLGGVLPAAHKSGKLLILNARTSYKEFKERLSHVEHTREDRCGSPSTRHGRPPPQQREDASQGQGEWREDHASDPGAGKRDVITLVEGDDYTMKRIG